MAWKRSRVRVPVSPPNFAIVNYGFAWQATSFSKSKFGINTVAKFVQRNEVKLDCSYNIVNYGFVRQATWFSELKISSKFALNPLTFAHALCLHT
jgi:hypothetical protein